MQPASAAATAPGVLSQTLIRFIWRNSGRHQLVLAGLSILVFLLGTAPLELQRCMVNDIVQGGQFRPVLVLAGIYAALALAEGGIKLILNIYGAWISEKAVRHLRQRIAALVDNSKLADVNDNADQDPDRNDAGDRGRKQGVETSLILSEVEPVGDFIGTSVSQPLLQGGLLISVFGYLAFLDYRMALLSLLVFMPQVIFVPLLQRAINRRAEQRITVLRDVSGGVIASATPATEGSGQNDRIDHVFSLNMSVYKLKFSMNFLMNLMYHLGVVGALVIGGWFVVTGRTELGTVVAFMSGLAKINDPWGDIIDWFRALTITIVKYDLIRDAVAWLTGADADRPTVPAASTS
jgi:ABC-type multidrug transport system fused ATPase/permease subunit